MAERFVFDAAGVEALEPGEREWRAWDKTLPGFGVRIRPSGTKSWIVRARTRGADGKVRRQRVTIGRCDEVSLEEARAQARRLLGAAAGAAAVKALPAAGMDERASRGRDDSLGDPAPKAGSGGDAPAGSPAEDDRGGRKAGAAVGRDDPGRPRAPESAAPAGRTVGGGDLPDAAAVADLAKTVTDLTERGKGVLSSLARFEVLSAKVDRQLEELSGAVPASIQDRRRRRRRRVWAVLAMVAVLAVGIGCGIAIQSREPVLPQADPTRGWKDHVWNYYGETFMGCFQRAKKTESGYADCTLKVRAR